MKCAEIDKLCLAMNMSSSSTHNNIWFTNNVVVAWSATFFEVVNNLRGFRKFQN
jgi:hypothetical protein